MGYGRMELYRPLRKKEDGVFTVKSQRFEIRISALKISFFFNYKLMSIVCHGKICDTLSILYVDVCIFLSIIELLGVHCLFNLHIKITHGKSVNIWKTRTILYTSSTTVIKKR